MKLCIAGKNNIAVDILLYSLNYFSKDSICVLLNKIENYKNTWQKSLGFYANLLDIQILELKEVQKIENLIFISLQFDRIINPLKFKTDKLYNIHFSYLPEFKGMYTSFFPILHGEKYSGVTLHEIDKGIDTGKIISQEKFNIDGFTCGDLYNKYSEIGTLLVKKNFEFLISGSYDVKQQPLIGSTYFNKESFDFTNLEINIRQTSYQIYLQVKALYFRPYQLPTFKGFEICNVKILENNQSIKVGTIIEDNPEYLLVQTIDSRICLYKDYYENLLDAIKSLDYDKVEYYSNFVAKNSNINEYNKFGWNPIIIACYIGSLEAVKILQKYGGNLFSKNLNGTTTLMYAKSAYEKSGNLNLINYLLRQGVSAKDVDILKRTVFDYTTDNQLIDILKDYD